MELPGKLSNPKYSAAALGLKSEAPVILALSKSMEYS